MKRLFLSLTIIFLATTAWAAEPILVCDPNPVEDQITHYVVYRDGVEYARPPACPEGGTYGFELPLTEPGAFTWTAKAMNAWGESGPSDPYISPPVASKPGGVRMGLR